MLSVAEAQAQLLKNFQVGQGETLPLAEALGRVVSQPVISRHDLPPFSNSAMDGFAVIAGDVAGANAQQPVRLQVVADIAAGALPHGRIQPGQAMRIMTGAPLPDGADAIVPVENTNLNRWISGEAAPAEVDVLIPVRIGDHFRRRGEDIRAGRVVIPAGQKLRPQELGILALLGFDTVTVYRKPHVAVLSTGDELLNPGETLAEGKIFDSNSTLLAALAERAGAEALNLGIAGDYEAEIQASLERALALGADLIVSSAGVSVGAYDYVRTVIERNGNLDFWKVNIRPGRPIAFGNYRQVPFFGLPGNPVSAYVGFEVFIRPAINKMLGLETKRAVVRARLEQAIESDGRESYLRGIVEYNAGWSARLAGHQGSGNLHSLVRANALLIIPSEVKSLPIGTELDAWLFEQ